MYGYNHSVNGSSVSGPENRALFVIAYVVLAAVAVLGLPMAYEAGVGWLSIAILLGLFGLALAFVNRLRPGSIQSRLYLLVQAALVTVMMVQQQGPTIYGVLFFLLSAQAVQLVPEREGFAWIGAFTLLTAMGFVQGEWREALVGVPIYAGGYLFFGIFARALVRADQARRRSQSLLTQLQAAHDKLQEYALRVEELAVAEERNRLAREMHDTLGHRLTVAAVQLEGAQRLIPAEPNRATDMVATVREQVREALGELRRTVATLQTPLEADLELSHALNRLAAGFEAATGITVHRNLPESMPDLSGAQRMALYRVAQESLTNVQRHARAQQAWLTLLVRPGQVVLLVGDDGVGFTGHQPKEAGFGLRGLRERADQLGGELSLETRPGGGAQLRFWLPLPGP